MPDDLFISYCRDDNESGRITALIERIEADYLAFDDGPLKRFFDMESIPGMDDWRHRILQGLREAKLMLLVLSPNYLKSQYCQWEIVEYLKYEHARAAGGQGVAPVYFIEVPGLDAPGFEEQAADWVSQVRRRNHFDLRPWHEAGEDALKQQSVRERLDSLNKSLHQRITKLRRAADAPGNLPAHNPYFVGRQSEMQRLHESAGLGRTGVLTAIQGMGGLGKTALAIQYAYAYADYYPGGRWLLNCAGDTHLATVIRRLDSELNITFTEDEKRDDARAAQRILAELEARTAQAVKPKAAEDGGQDGTQKQDERPAQAMLLLDNVDCPDMLQLPQTELVNGKRWLHVLATTRMGEEDFSHDPAKQTLLAVDELPINDAVSLIERLQPGERFADDSERAAAHAIAELLGGFTLAVEVVAVYLAERRGRVSCADFLKRLQAEGFDSIASDTKRGVAHREKLIGVTLGPTLDLLSAEAIEVLSYAALLPPDMVPVPWLRKLAGEKYPDLKKDADPGYDDPWLSLINHLIGLRLLQVVDTDPETKAPRLVRMHRLVQGLVRERPGFDVSTRRERITAHALKRSNALQDGWFIPANRWEVEPLIEQCRLMLAAHWPEREYLADKVSNCLRDLARYTEAEPLVREALEIRRQALPEGHPDIATGLNSLASLLQDQGKPAEAEPLYREALDIWRRALPEGHPDIATGLNNLASLLQAQGKPAEAEPLLREALDSWRKALPAGHPTIEIIRSNLAWLLQKLGKPAEA